MKNFIHFGLMANHEKHETKAVTKELFEAVIDDKSVAESVMRVSELVKSGRPAEEIRAAKDRLPAFIFMAQCTDGGARPLNENAKHTGLCMHDFDHLNYDIKEFFATRVLPAKEDIGLLLAYVTPSGTGLRLVTRLMAGESINACQMRIANFFGLKKDDQCKNISRLSYAVHRDYVLFVDDAIFCLEEPTCEFAGNDGAALTLPQGSTTLVASQPQALVLSDCVNYADETYYKNEIKMSRIIEELIKRIADEGILKVGDRNGTLFRVACELRPISGRNFDFTYRMLRFYFINSGLTDAEIRKTIASAMGRTGSYSKTPSPTMTGIIEDLKAEYGIVHIDDITPMPELPKVMMSILALFPESLREAVFFACLPLLGFLATRVRFNYMNNQERSLSFSTHLMAPPASNKSLIKNLKSLLLKAVVEKENEMREAENAEKKARREQGNGSKTKKVYNEHPIRILGGNTTGATLFKRLKEARFLHLLVFTEELSHLMLALKKNCQEFKQAMLSAFANEEYSKETAGDASDNFAGPVYINSLTAGTNGTTMNFYKNTEDGLITRTIFVTLPDNLGEDMAVFGTPNGNDRNAIERVIRNLSAEQGKNGETVHYSFHKLDVAFAEWLQESKETYFRDMDESWRRLAFRSAEIGYRVGVLMWLVSGKPQGINSQSEETRDVIQKIIDVAIWAANYVRAMQYRVFGMSMQEQIEQVEVPTTGAKRSGQSSELFEDLGDTFSLQDLIFARQKNNLSCSVDSAYKTVSLWMKVGMIVNDISNRVYVKTENYRSAS